MIPILGLAVGVVLGLVFDPTVPLWLQPYLPIAVVAALDAVFGGIRARLDGIFDSKVFVVSFVSNVLVAGLIAQWGPIPEVLPFLIHIAVALPFAVVVWRTPETHRGGGVPGPWWRQLRVPSAGHRRFTRVVLVAADGERLLGAVTFTGAGGPYAEVARPAQPADRHGHRTLPVAETTVSVD